MRKNYTNQLFILIPAKSKMFLDEWVSKCPVVWLSPVQCYNFISTSTIRYRIIICNSKIIDLITFIRTVPAVVFWQWVNQSFNALVNYTNRNANSTLTVNQLGVSYVSATTSALIAAIGFKGFCQKRASSIMQVGLAFLSDLIF